MVVKVFQLGLFFNSYLLIIQEIKILNNSIILPLFESISFIDARTITTKNSINYDLPT